MNIPRVNLLTINRNSPLRFTVTCFVRLHKRTGFENHWRHKWDAILDSGGMCEVNLENRLARFANLLPRMRPARVWPARDPLLLIGGSRGPGEFEWNASRAQGLHSAHGMNTTDATRRNNDTREGRTAENQHVRSEEFPLFGCARVRDGNEGSAGRCDFHLSWLHSCANRAASRRRKRISYKYFFPSLNKEHGNGSVSLGKREVHGGSR